MRKLVDKLVVHCPNTELCKLTLPRSDLAAHLKERYSFFCVGVFTNDLCPVLRHLQPYLDLDD